MPQPPVVALEIGTAKVIALVGEMREDGHVMITGMGELPSRGVSKGQVTDVDEAVETVRAALKLAEDGSGVTIREVFLAVSGAHVSALVNGGVVPVLDEDGEITRDDMDKVMDVARAVNLPPDREILHTICRHYCIDDRQKVIQPEGMQGARLGLEMLVVHGVRNILRNTVNVAENVPVHVEDVAFSGLCSALSVLSAEQKKGGALVIDLGAGTTEYLAYSGGVIAESGALGVGGDHVTNDITLAFNIPSRHAELCKRESGSAIIPEGADTEHVALGSDVGFAGRSLPLTSLCTVIHARMDEIFKLVRTRLGNAGLLQSLGGGVVLVGGGAHIRGACELASEVFGTPCEIGRPRSVTGLATATEGPQYATCSGLVQYGYRMLTHRRRSNGFKGILRGILGR